MNWSEVQANWHEMSVVVKAHWPQLSDDDLTKINANRDALARALQRRYGLSDQDAEREICEFEDDVRRPGAVK